MYFQVIPILEPEFVADETVKAILMNKPMIMLPWWVSSLVMIKNIVHTNPAIKLNKMFGLNCSMDEFVQTRTTDDNQNKKIK